MKNLFGGIMAAAILIIIGTACNASFTTANISELKFGRNETAEPAVTSFNTGEDIYAVATVSNASGKFKLTWKVTYDNVKGRDKGEEVGTKSIDFEGSSRLWQTFSSPLPGEYKVEATLIDDSGKVIETKSGMVTVTGSAPDSGSDDDDN
ncbi:MAG: hypothetical protein AB7Q37_17885 [Pyrinomonadaceae bacterium]